MLLPFRHRLSVAERCFWLMLFLMMALAISGHAQSRATKRVKHTSGARHSQRVVRTVSDDDDNYDFVRNHGTGLRLGVELASARTAVRGGGLPAVLEVGAFHQHCLGKVGSVQVEAVYFRQPATATAWATRGLRLPVLLVINPFDNVSIHLGPQVRWQTGAMKTAEADGSANSFQPSAPLTTEFVFGAEARVSQCRIGTRYSLPIAQLTDLPALGDQFGSAWHAGQMQVYLGVNIFNR